MRNEILRLTAQNDNVSVGGAESTPPTLALHFARSDNTPTNPNFRRVTCGLFHRYGFGKIAGLVDITTAFQRHIIGEQL